MASHLRKRGLDILVQVRFVGGTPTLHDVAWTFLSKHRSSAGRRRYAGLFVGWDADATSLGVCRRREHGRYAGGVRSVSVSLTRKTTTQGTREEVYFRSARR
ncbi:MAG: hypothetical protein ACK4P5_00105 [Fimbriimonadales bacterium]